MCMHVANTQPFNYTIKVIVNRKNRMLSFVGFATSTIKLPGFSVTRKAKVGSSTRYIMPVLMSILNVEC